MCERGGRSVAIVSVPNLMNKGHGEGSADQRDGLPDNPQKPFLSGPTAPDIQSQCMQRAPTQYEPSNGLRRSGWRFTAVTAGPSGWGEFGCWSAVVMIDAMRVSGHQFSAARFS